MSRSEERYIINEAPEGESYASGMVDKVDVHGTRYQVDSDNAYSRYMTNQRNERAMYFHEKRVDAIGRYLQTFSAIAKKISPYNPNDLIIILLDKYLKDEFLRPFSNTRETAEQKTNAHMLLEICQKIRKDKLKDGNVICAAFFSCLSSTWSENDVRIFTWLEKYICEDVLKFKDGKKFYQPDEKITGYIEANHQSLLSTFDKGAAGQALDSKEVDLAKLLNAVHVVFEHKKNDDDGKPYKFKQGDVRFIYRAADHYSTRVNKGFKTLTDFYRVMGKYAAFLTIVDMVRSVMSKAKSEESTLVLLADQNKLERFLKTSFGPEAISGRNPASDGIRVLINALYHDEQFSDFRARLTEKLGQLQAEVQALHDKISPPSPAAEASAAQSAAPTAEEKGKKAAEPDDEKETTEEKSFGLVSSRYSTFREQRPTSGSVMSLELSMISKLSIAVAKPPKKPPTSAQQNPGQGKGVGAGVGAGAGGKPSSASFCPNLGSDS